MRNLAVCFLGLAIAGCSQHAVTLEAPIQFAELFLQRASSEGTEFEQYKISEGGIFIECGAVIQGKIRPDHQRFIPTGEIDITQIQERAADVMHLAEGSKKLTSPGRGEASLFDPGIFTLKLEAGTELVQMNTSVNEVANAERPLTKALKRFAYETRRTLKNEECGADPFYGIPGSE